MADQAEQVSTTGLVDTKQRPSAARRRQYSEALKRQMVAETQVPGASVSIVARRHDVNSNQLFRWRRQLLPKAAVESGAMVPVEIATDDSTDDVRGAPRRTQSNGLQPREASNPTRSELYPDGSGPLGRILCCAPRSEVS